jgi:WD40 repeat protein
VTEPPPPASFRDETVKIWDLNVGKCINTLVGHTDNVWYLQFDEDKIVSGSADKTICFWDFRFSPSPRVAVVLANR